MLNVDILGQDELNRRLENLSRAEFFSDFIKDVAQSAFDEAEQAIGKHSKTGLLERSLGSGAERVGDLSYVVKSSGQIAPYNIWVHFGSRPHEIRPKDRKALRWVGGNSFYFAKFVKHPGYAGDAFMVTATQNVLRDFDSLVQKHMKGL